jgi:CheY-like chemotaxis protein
METKRKVLYIEDERAMIDLVRLILRPMGFDVTGAEGGRQGLDMARAEKPDLILLDLMMPGLDGWEVLQQLRADDELAAIPVIVVTVRTRSMDQASGRDIAGIEDYITKPFSQARLLESVQRALGMD